MSAGSETPRCSVCIPTWRGEADLRRLLPALARQELAGGFEIVAIDSSSGDGGPALLEAAGARVSTIPQREFGHGRTRNELALRARADVLVFLSQDALPAASDFLARLVEPFDDPRVAGAYARILPHPSDDPLTARTALDQPEARSASAARGTPAGSATTELERDEALRFNNVASAIRAAVLRSIPFPELPFGEDSAWADAALRAGWKVVFTPSAVVHHAHAYGPREAFRRNRIDAAFQREHYGRRLRAGPWSVLRGIAFEVRRDLAHLARERPPGLLRHALRSPCLRTAQVLGQLAGSHGWGRDPWERSATN